MLTEGAGDLRAGALVDVGDDHPGAFGNERLRGRTTDPVGAARDDRHLAREVVVHQLMNIVHQLMKSARRSAHRAPDGARESRMAPGRPRGERNSTTSEALLDAAEAIMLDEGYAAVTSRRVAEQAGTDAALVYYYFGTMEDLFVALFRRNASAAPRTSARRSPHRSRSGHCGTRCTTSRARR